MSTEEKTIAFEITPLGAWVLSAEYRHLTAMYHFLKAMFDEEELAALSPDLATEHERLGSQDIHEGIFVFPHSTTQFTRVVFKHNGTIYGQSERNIVSLGDIMGWISDSYLNDYDIQDNIIRVFSSETEFTITFEKSDRVLALNRMSEKNHSHEAAHEFRDALTRSDEARRALVKKHLYKPGPILLSQESDSQLTWPHPSFHPLVNMNPVKQENRNDP